MSTRTFVLVGGPLNGRLIATNLMQVEVCTIDRVLRNCISTTDRHELSHHAHTYKARRLRIAWGTTASFECDSLVYEDLTPQDADRAAFAMFLGATLASMGTSERVRAAST